MTRINTLDPVELMDQHLVAEYREIFMVGGSLLRSLKSPNWDPKNIPKQFTLNKGHVSFFYDKGKYLYNRYSQLITAMKDRGMNPDPNRTFPQWQWPAELFGDWTPTEAGRDIVRARIKLRISEKPNWYKYRGEKI